MPDHPTRLRHGISPLAGIVFGLAGLMLIEGYAPATRHEARDADSRGAGVALTGAADPAAGAVAGSAASYFSAITVAWAQ